MKHYIISVFSVIAFMFSLCPSAFAQVDKKDVRRGNRDFRKENYKEADIDYSKALVKDSMSVAANYNIASTMYRMGEMDQAAKAMDRIRDVAPADENAASYWFNRGDIAIAREDWQGAVDAFKQSLILNPDDIDAKENYIYAKKKLQDQQNNQDQNNQDQDNQDQNNQDQNNQDNKNDQNQDNKDNQDDQENKDNQDNQDNRNQPDNSDNQPQSKPQITPQAAQQMLQAIQAKEKETQDKVNKEKAKALKSRQKEKNW
ncbi:MAG: tetratricopeptide repeat protein [Candidatus Cryptobacteroides sp.]